jgi:hypothetical protein
LNLNFSGTALEEALALQQQQGETKEQDKPEETSTSPTPLTPVTGVREDAAPKRDFTRAANSIVRDAIPAGVFTGKGKHLYDYLYSQTRGAIVPVHSARIPTEKVMAGAGMSRNTFRFQLERLCNAGLIEVDQRPGEHGGNVYTVRLPEEVGLEKGEGGDRGHRGYRGQNLPRVEGSETDPCDRGSFLIDSTVYGESKTYIKTNTENDDDEAFADFLAALKNASRQLTGKDSSAADRRRWAELAELLVTELKIAAGRTTVSSVPAFLSEHLRRRLWKKERRQIEAEATSTGAAPDATYAARDATGCPDCYGTGMYYPEGFDRGVARCKHEKLAVGDGE